MMNYTKKEMIVIGQLLKSVDDFDSRIRINYLNDPKVKDKYYVQVRSSATLDKSTRKWFGKYVGVKGKHTKEDLVIATEALKKRFRDVVNKKMRPYNCKLEDFK